MLDQRKRIISQRVTSRRWCYAEVSTYLEREWTQSILLFRSLTKWPTIALETGYSESPDGLSRDADILLNGSDGRIGIVILVKIEPLGPDVQTPQNGHVEVWTWDKNQSKKVKIGHRKVNYYQYFPFVYGVHYLYLPDPVFSSKDS